MRCTMQGFDRGVYRQEALIVSAVDAFGLVQAKCESAGGGQLWVLPGGSGTAMPLPGAAPEGARPASRRPPGSDPVPQVSGTRPYAPGDPLRRIHWRSSARTGELRAKETELPAAGRQLIVLDAAGAGGSAEPPCGRIPRSAAVEAAAGLRGARLSRARGCDWPSATASPAPPRRRGGRDGELLRLLAAVPRGERADAFAELALREARLAGGGALTLVTARADAQLAAARRLPRGTARVSLRACAGVAWAHARVDSAARGARLPGYDPGAACARCCAERRCRRCRDRHLTPILAPLSRRRILPIPRPAARPRLSLPAPSPRSRPASAPSSRRRPPPPP
ncbi:DUF58 domain-containing protein [Paenibacillus elgii]|uniref:DUF58 domain-containing protein n=1 Tax=Paenibacillus elgii TaxID=189691 RepID=UPI00398B3C99